ncbi:hypothetical protein KJA16_02385 [Patescibacteria group bacterium]|nr:hypothetical protein [Patescibacteria group bacterium]
MKKLFPILLISTLFFVTASSAQGASASLYLSPPTGTYRVGDIFAVAVTVDSEGEAINVAEGTLIFDPDELNVVSISKSDSIFTLWTTEPIFSNSDGTINFGGGTPNNFIGSSGTIITISFRAEIIGASNVDFSTGSVLAADHKGTNVLASMGSGTYVIQPKIVLPLVDEYIPPENAPTAPIISSSTHPYPDRWYLNNDPEFTWEVPEDITGVKLLVNHKPIDTPTVFYSEPISEKRLEDLADGVWYLHAQLENKFGWGGISHFKFQIDTTLLEPPIITEYPKELISGFPLLIKGISVPEVTIKVYIQREGKIETGQIQSDKDGNWFYIHDRILEKGVYTIFAEAINLKGAKSNPSEKVVIYIAPPACVRIGEKIIDYLSITIPLLVLIVAVISGFLWIWRNIKPKRRKLEEEATEAEKALYQAFKDLRKEVKEQVAKLDGKPGLSEKEKKICHDLKKALKNSEKFIEKEIRDIIKELE